MINTNGTTLHYDKPNHNSTDLHYTYTGNSICHFQVPTPTAVKILGLEATETGREGLASRLRLSISGPSAVNFNTVCPKGCRGSTAWSLRSI